MFIYFILFIYLFYTLFFILSIFLLPFHFPFYVPPLSVDDMSICLVFNVFVLNVTTPVDHKSVVSVRRENMDVGVNMGEGK